MPVFWPEYDGGTWAEYVVSRCREPDSNGEVRLAVTYDEADNGGLIERYGDWFWWGTNTIILQQGQPEGDCEWRTQGYDEFETVKWEAFDVEGTGDRPRTPAQIARRYPRFRSETLASDGRRCVLTGESTQAALEAAHLVPARRGDNDVPSNGITLRADVHKLFDEGLFTFGKDRAIKLTDGEGALSGEYRRLLRNKRLPATTYERVKGTLALRQFRDRCSSPDS